jgi:small acid-soluble spore protein N (minor)
MLAPLLEKIKVRRRENMTNSNDKQSHFTPNHIGTKSRGFGGNKGKKMQNKSNEHPQVMQTKGE